MRSFESNARLTLRSQDYQSLFQTDGDLRVPSTPVTITYYANVYHYEPTRLWAPYAVAILLAALACVAGGFSLLESRTAIAFPR